MSDTDLAFSIPPPGADASAQPSASTSTPSTSTGERKSKKRKSAPVAEAAPAKDQMEQDGQDGAAAAAEGGEEERVLSHKEKRLLKKRKLAAEAAGEEFVPPSAPAPAAAAAAPATTMIGQTLVGNTPSRSAHGVWVGNLNFATHARELLGWFADKGLKEVTRINMPNGKRSHENNRGFAYLDFPSATDVTIAVGLSEQHLDGRKLLIKSSSDYTGRPAASASTLPASSLPESALPALDPSALDPRAPAPAASSATPAAGAAPSPGAVPQTLNRTARKILDKQRNPAGPTLFIGNLGFETKVEDVREMFDRNQVKAAEWEPKVKGKKGVKSGRNPKDKNKKGKEKAGEEGEGEETDRDDDDSSSSSGSDSDSDSSDDDEEEDGEGEKENADDGGKKKREKKEKKEKGPLDLAHAKDAGIRKIRLGTFEDSGKCKGWCFVDFHLPAQATRALLNLRNHTLNGRKLNVEFASADAVRRGQLGTRAASKANGRARREGGGAGGRDDGERPQKRQRGGEDGGAQREGRGGAWGDDAARAYAAAGDFAAPAAPKERMQRPKKDRSGGGGDEGGRKERAKPGAALANAQRASEAIVESRGRKTTFD
ncbi:hypothetical protein JCM10213_002629 [Rhodosporidiobolus nylandii]